MTDKIMIDRDDLENRLGKLETQLKEGVKTSTKTVTLVHSSGTDIHDRYEKGVVPIYLDKFIEAEFSRIAEFLEFLGQTTFHEVDLDEIQLTRLASLRCDQAKEKILDALRFSSKSIGRIKAICYWKDTHDYNENDFLESFLVFDEKKEDSWGGFSLRRESEEGATSSEPEVKVEKREQDNGIT